MINTEYYLRYNGRRNFAGRPSPICSNLCYYQLKPLMKSTETPSQTELKEFTCSEDKSCKMRILTWISQLNRNKLWDKVGVAFAVNKMRNAFEMVSSQLSTLSKFQWDRLGGRTWTSFLTSSISTILVFFCSRVSHVFIVLQISYCFFCHTVRSSFHFTLFHCCYYSLTFSNCLDMLYAKRGRGKVRVCSIHP